MSEPWTEAEDEAIREQFAAGVHVTLPGRTQASVYHRLNRLGLARKPRWTAAEYRRLELLWDTDASLTAIAREMKRPVKSVYWHAQHRGLDLGAPQGFEYVTVYARRSGFAKKTFVDILRWAGVRTKIVRARPDGHRHGHHFRYVDPLDAEDAIAKWLSTEPVNAAARARGLIGWTLTKWLKEAGVVDDRTIRKARWRVPTEVIDRVVAERQACLSARAAAARYGVNPYQLRRKLRAAGFVPKRRNWFVPVDLVEQVLGVRKAAW